MSFAPRDETLDEKIRRVVSEEIDIVPWDPDWPVLFLEEEEHLRACLPQHLIGRIEHFGSTSVPGLAAKPIVDMLIEVTSLEDARILIPPILEAEGYDYFWRPSFGDDVPPFYAWFIKRDENGLRTHHLHMVEANFPNWERLLFRDRLIEDPALAAEYAELKRRAAEDHPRDRVRYTEAKTEFVVRVTREAAERKRSGEGEGEGEGA